MVKDFVNLVSMIKLSNSQKSGVSSDLIMVYDEIKLISK